MGMSTSGILAYGFDLGGPEKWEVREAGEYGELPPLDWYNEDDENSYFIEAAERRLLASIGFTETWHQGNEGYFRREREARAQLGVAFETYCSGDYPMHLLTTKVITAYGGDAHQIDHQIPLRIDAPPGPQRQGTVNVQVAEAERNRTSQAEILDFNGFEDRAAHQDGYASAANRNRPPDGAGD